MIFLSAGVKTREVDFSTYVGQVSTTIVGMVGAAQKGPIGVATLVTSPGDFIKKFGEPTISDNGPMAALNFLKKGNQLWYTRVAENTAATAQVSFDGKDNASATVTGVLKLTALEKGTYANNISASITAVAAGAFTLNIFKNSILSETFTCDLDTASDKYVGNINSQWVTPTVTIGTATSITEVATAKTLTGGLDGTPVLAATIIGTETQGLQAYANADGIDINILCAPGRWEDTVVAELIRIAEARQDCISLIDPPQGLSVKDVADFHNGIKGAHLSWPEAALNSSFAATFYPWAQVSNPYTKVKEWCPPSSIMAGVIANNDNVANVWNAPAGLNRALLQDVVGLELDLAEGDRDFLYGNGNAVNPIINYKKNGFVVWGQRTLQRKPSATDRINVRRTMCMIRKAIAVSTAYVVFEQIDSFTWNYWKGMVNPYLKSIKDRGGIYDFKVVMDESTVTPEMIDQNQMPGVVYIKPSKTAEFIPIDFILTSTGASFS